MRSGGGAAAQRSPSASASRPAASRSRRAARAVSPARTSDVGGARRSPRTSRTRRHARGRQHFDRRRSDRQRVRRGASPRSRQVDQARSRPSPRLGRVDAQRTQGWWPFSGPLRSRETASASSGVARRRGPGTAARPRAAPPPGPSPSAAATARAASRIFIALRPAGPGAGGHPDRRPATRTRETARTLRPSGGVRRLGVQRLDEVHRDRERAVGRRLDLTRTPVRRAVALASEDARGRAGRIDRAAARRADARIGRRRSTAAAWTRSATSVSASSRARPSAANDGTGSNPLAEPGGPGRRAPAATLQLARLPCAARNQPTL